MEEGEGGTGLEQWGAVHMAVDGMWLALVQANRRGQHGRGRVGGGERCRRRAR